MSLLQANMAGLGGSGAPGGALAGGTLGSHAINQSLRFNNDDNAYLEFTPSSAGNRDTWTISMWVKRSGLGLAQSKLFAAGSSFPSNHNNAFYMWFQSDDTMQIYNESGGSYFTRLETTRKFRDASSWYHIVYVYDSTQATSTDRQELYINGVKETDFDLRTDPGLNVDSQVNATHVHRIGASTIGNTFDGYMAEIHFVDGTALDADDFGETIDGVWVPKEYTGGSYGTNGFHLPFGQDISSGSSFFFDRSSPSQVTFTNSSHYDIGSSDDFTLEAFIQPTSTMMSNYCFLLGHYGGPGGPYMMLQFSPSSNLLYFYTGNGAGHPFYYTAGDIVAGQWHHIAINRVSGSLRLFLDGVQKGSTISSSTTAWDNNQFDINIAGNDSSYSGSLYSFDGYISNVRMVVGSAVYADGASITVPTSTLTAVTNTQLLALTTSTFTADGSTNNVTGTITGTGYSSSTISPFADFNFYDDTSGNNNDFTANNLVTSDIVPDSPTNNFATNNGAMRANITQSEGNLKMVGVGNNYDNLASTFEIDAEDTDGWYWEYRSIGNDTATGVGIAVSNNQYFNQSDSPNPFAHENQAGNVHYQGDGNKRVSGGLPQVMVIAGLLAI